MSKSPETPKSPEKPKKDGPKKDPARPTRAKASKPDLAPLAPHLAQLLNPALAPGFEDAGQTAYDAADPLGAEEVQKWVLGDLPPQGGGVQATQDSLAELLRLGDPNLRDKKPWVPHRPELPEKSEGGVKFELVSEYTPKGDQPAAIAELVKGIEAQERDQLGQDLHNGQRHRRDAAPGADPRAQQDAGRAALWRVQELLS